MNQKEEKKEPTFEERMNRAKEEEAKEIEEMKSKATPIPVIEEVPPIKVETQKTENPEIISSAIVEVMADNQKEENKNKILKGSFGLDELADFEQEISSLENELNKAIE